MLRVLRFKLHFCRFDVCFINFPEIFFHFGPDANEQNHTPSTNRIYTIVYARNLENYFVEPTSVIYPTFSNEIPQLQTQRKKRNDFMKSNASPITDQNTESQGMG